MVGPRPGSSGVKKTNGYVTPEAAPPARIRRKRSFSLKTANKRGLGRRCASLVSPKTGRFAGSTLREHVFINAAVLHDDDEVFAWIGHQLDVGCRIAVNQQKVSQRAFSHFA